MNRTESGIRPTDPNQKLIETYSFFIKDCVGGVLESLKKKGGLTRDESALQDKLIEFSKTQEMGILFSPVCEGGKNMTTVLDDIGEGPVWHELVHHGFELKKLRPVPVKPSGNQQYLADKERLQLKKTGS